MKNSGTISIKAATAAATSNHNTKNNSNNSCCNKKKNDDSSNHDDELYQGLLSTSSTQLRRQNERARKVTLYRMICLIFICSFCMGYYVGSYQSYYYSKQSLPEDTTSRLRSNNNNNNNNNNYNKRDSVKIKYGDVVRIAVLGERNSGTTWITEHLQDCFPTLNVTPSLNRHKHWFQKDDRTQPRLNTIVVGMFRNIYDWGLAMRKRPHHAPSHLHMYWKDFLCKPWTFQNNTRPIQDLPFANISGPICQEGYSYKEIIPCLRIKQKSLYVENTDDADGDDADDSDSSSLIVADDHGTFHRGIHNMN